MISTSTKTCTDKSILVLYSYKYNCTNKTRTFHKCNHCVIFNKFKIYLIIPIHTVEMKSQIVLRHSEIGRNILRHNV